MHSEILCRFSRTRLSGDFLNMVRDVGVSVYR
jgi:hypothetical protein